VFIRVHPWLKNGFRVFCAFRGSIRVLRLAFRIPTDFQQPPDCLASRMAGRRRAVAALCRAAKAEKPALRREHSKSRPEIQGGCRKMAGLRRQGNYCFPGLAGLTSTALATI
jgi:hypothetical protein